MIGNFDRMSKIICYNNQPNEPNQLLNVNGIDDDIDDHQFLRYQSLIIIKYQHISLDITDG